MLMVILEIRGKNGAKVSSTIPYPTQASSPASSPSKRGFTTSPSNAPHAEQCQGITKQAKRCTRRVKLEKVETGEDFHRFCHQHGKDILTQKGFFNKRGVWIEFDFWIPQQGLSTFTQIQLRLTMEKPIAHADVAGWIYVYSMPQTARHAEYKVGRTNNINRRIDNWSKQCNKELVLREYFPSSPVSSTSRLHTTFAADPGFVCKHCGKRHREVFKLQRMYNRKGTEFENVVKPMIENTQHPIAFSRGWVSEAPLKRYRLIDIQRPVLYFILVLWVLYTALYSIDSLSWTSPLKREDNAFWFKTSKKI
ncbi:hypothetical protein E3P77_01492 [Wallemia ichthyophaga]|nr:hypothetical protein E3P77_01492 [Wallemia ichthyophaga]